MSAPLLVWFRHDLRLADNPALQAALKQKVPLIPVYIWSPEEETPWVPGGATKWWLHHALTALSADLAAHGSRLIIRTGSSWPVLEQLLQETGARGVYWNRRFEPQRLKIDRQIVQHLTRSGHEVETFNGNLLFNPPDVLTQAQTPFKVFTPFWRKCQSLGEPEPALSTPARLPAPAEWPASDMIAQLKLLPRIPWDAGFSAYWEPGSAGAKKRLDRFLQSALFDYSTRRDLPGEEGVSGLSPHLHFGELSPQQIWRAVRRAEQIARETGSSPANSDGSPYLRQLIWREFAHHLLFHFPHTPDQPLRPEFEQFPWIASEQTLTRWQKGLTGYPIVDAGMRQLWQTGWMHNRVRMIVGSFLVKDLLLSWQDGAAWFWDTLVDADLANNTLGWQWIGGCGADAAPYFRVFNPTLQSCKFDPEGRYIRRWVPELARLSDDQIHEPWTVRRSDLQAAGITLGDQYPQPMVDHSVARERALKALAQMSSQTRR